MYEPDRYDGQAIPEALTIDLLEWLAERHLYGGFRRIEYSEDGTVKGGCYKDGCDVADEPHFHMRRDT